MGFKSDPSRIVEMPEEDDKWFTERESEETESQPERKEEEVLIPA